MADIAITAASVLAGANADINRLHNAGATITAGQAVYLEGATKTWKLADSNGASAEIKTADGFALNGASAGQPLAVQASGDITIGGTLTAGVAYYLSATPGAICPVADVGSGDNVCLLGLAKSTTVLGIDIQAPGVSN
jgi:hypothetical protein